MGNFGIAVILVGELAQFLVWRKANGGKVVGLAGLLAILRRLADLPLDTALLAAFDLHGKAPPAEDVRRSNSSNNNRNYKGVPKISA
jgi:hypothetical protein